MIEGIEKWTSKTKFNSLDDFETYPTADIICPTCNKSVHIKMRDLKEAHSSNYSKLKEQDREDVLRMIVDSSPTLAVSNLDYYCPFCTSITSVLFEFWAGGRHGEFGFELKYIISIANNK